MLKSKEKPIFQRRLVEFQPAYPLTHMSVSNNQLVLAMSNKVLMKIDLKNTKNIKELDLKPLCEDAKLSNLFLDPSGQHVLLSFAPRNQDNPAEFVYIDGKTLKSEKVLVLKSHTVTTIGWSYTVGANGLKTASSNSISTGAFIFGTSKGLIFEAEIEAGRVKYCKQLFDVGKAGPTVVSGLEYFFYPESSKCYVIVATAKKLYRYRGTLKEDEPIFRGVFNNYLRDAPEEALSFGDTSMCPQSDQCANRLQVLRDLGSNSVRAIGYISDMGVLQFNNVEDSSKTEDDFLNDFVSIPYPAAKETGIGRGEAKTPKSFVLTKYHALLLFDDTVKAVCTLNGKLVVEDVGNFEKYGRSLYLLRDPVAGTVWCLMEKAMFKFVISDESRDIWKIYLDNEQFDKAKEFAGTDPDKLDTIFGKQADYFFKRKDYEASALHYAMTKASFEDVALKFVQLDDTVALKTFLEKKLSSLSVEEDAKITVLVLWIIELFLHQLGSLRDFGKEHSPDYGRLESEFMRFMKQPAVKMCVSKNKKAVYDLMDSHGDKENLAYFTLSMRDYDEVIENYITEGKLNEALKTLQDQQEAHLYAKFVPALLDKLPEETIDLLIRCGRLFDPQSLLPKFSSKLNSSIAHHISRYLKHVVDTLKSTNRGVHNYLLSLHVHFDTEDNLMEYLESQGSDLTDVSYDPRYALMMCLEKKLTLPTVHMYTLMGQYEEAVELAIGVDLELAKRTANVPENDNALRKKLWLRIAQHVVKEKNDIQKAMEFLDLCELIKIEDILPFFPNFVTIDQFKDAICNSLQGYNKHIQSLKDEMEDATKSAEHIREEIAAVRNRCAIVRATDQCSLCGIPLLIKNFYVFPCGHQLHAECLLSEVVGQLSQPRRARLAELQKRMNEISQKQEALSTGSSVISCRDQLKSDIDDIIASECVYCGDSMIKNVDVPFIPEEEYDRLQQDWE